MFDCIDGISLAKSRVEPTSKSDGFVFPPNDFEGAAQLSAAAFGRRSISLSPKQRARDCARLKAWQGS